MRIDYFQYSDRWNLPSQIFLNIIFCIPFSLRAVLVARLAVCVCVCLFVCALCHLFLLFLLLSFFPPPINFAADCFLPVVWASSQGCKIWQKCTWGQLANCCIHRYWCFGSPAGGCCWCNCCFSSICSCLFGCCLQKQDAVCVCVCVCVCVRERERKRLHMLNFTSFFLRKHDIWAKVFYEYFLFKHRVNLYVRPTTFVFATKKLAKRKCQHDHHSRKSISQT